LAAEHKAIIEEWSKKELSDDELQEKNLGLPTLTPV
jgi:hypothetical protein